MNNGNILVAEDDGALRDLIALILFESGYQVITASDGADALQKAQHNGSIDLLLSDLEMPRMNGDELAKHFAQLHPTAAIIITTTCIHKLNAEKRCELLPKPFNVSQLRSTVWRALQTRPGHNGEEPS